MDRAGEQLPAPRSGGILPGAIAGALLALAGHVALLRSFGTALPYRDQWKCTGVDILLPWAEGHLGWRNFFEPLNDHWPVLTRALSFMLVRLDGQWNNLLETSVNALLFAGAVALFLRLVLPGLCGWTRPAFALVTGVVFALPITWENTLWGIQSLVYLQIALTLTYFAAVCNARTFSWIWWSGQIAGAAALLTQHSGVLAQVAVMFLLGWRWWRGDGNRRVVAAGLALAFFAVVLFAAFFPPITVTAALKADSWELAADVFLRQLAWPLPHPAWAFMVYLPWIVWIGDRLMARRLAATDAFIFVCGLWVGAQAAAIGYGRGAETYTFVSRYCDFLALGFLLNAASLIRLWVRFSPTLARVAIAVFAIIWLFAPIKSFWWESTQSHAGYNLERRPGLNARNLERLKNYFAAPDVAALSAHGGDEFYPYMPGIVPVLNNPKFQSLLPPETGSPRARHDHGRLGWIPALLLRSTAFLTFAGVVLLGWSAVSAWRCREHRAYLIEPGLHTARSLGMSTLALFVASTGVCLAWENPWAFSRSERLRVSYLPASAGVSFSDLEFHRGDGNEHALVSTTGAVETQPDDQREYWYGTRLPTAVDFRGILKSRAITVRARYLIVPFAGYPCADGNGLRWRIVNPMTNEEKWISYVGPNPGVGWDMWTVDVSEYKGLDASLYLFDGREDAVGWVGVARPAQTDDAGFAAQWRPRLRMLRAEGAHRALAGFAAAMGMLCLATFGCRKMTNATWRQAKSSAMPGVSR